MVLAFEFRCGILRSEITELASDSATDLERYVLSM